MDLRTEVPKEYNIVYITDSIGTDQLLSLASRFHDIQIKKSELNPCFIKNLVYSSRAMADQIAPCVYVNDEHILEELGFTNEYVDEIGFRGNLEEGDLLLLMKRSSIDPEEIEVFEVETY